MQAECALAKFITVQGHVRHSIPHTEKTTYHCLHT